MRGNRGGGTETRAWVSSVCSLAAVPGPGPRGISRLGRGQAPTKKGLTSRYRCQPLVGEPHRFSVLVTPVGPAAPQWSPPPACPRHPGSRVVRDGTYGTRTVNRRQRYRCTPVDGSKPHSFTPPLARDHVHVGSEQCDACEELRGVHHGEPTVARQHT